MRQLTSEECAKVFSKLEVFLKDIKDDFFKGCALYLHNKSVFCIDDALYKKTSNIPKKNIVMVGTHIGKFTKTHRFFFTVGVLNILCDYSVKKVWIKWSAEMNVLYGNNVLKSHVLKTSEDIEDKDGVFLYNPKNVLLGFGIANRSLQNLERAAHNSMFIIRQSDKGEYIRNETKLK